MDDIEAKAREWKEEARALAVMWDVDPQFRDIFLALVSYCYGRKMLLGMLFDFASSLPDVKKLRISVMIQFCTQDLRRMINTVRKLVSKITDEEFDEGFRNLIQYLDSVVDSF